MAHLYFKYGTMNSGKSIEIIKVAHNYEEQGKRVLLFTPAIDTRIGENIVGSRTGLTRPAIPVKADTDLFELVRSEQSGEGQRISCVLVDEAQFLNKRQVLELTWIVDELDIPVMAFGLKNDFRNELFEGSYNLLVNADKIEEIKTICWHCDRKATMVVRSVNGVPVSEGDQIMIGGNDDYKPVCRSCYRKTFQGGL
ncbi:thymidine kinase [Cohnella sp. JJ-181]|uniref:thymidine kinase n=1 Tax=Cohnella rhizoplanae TaxID=2974897 RepID=UPI0022FF5F48|nr:thymidine kinase [Cohnella sp. JJ-181]CAI6082262.1 Thymidine kinase [Cohnella sp. JJ-181]